MAVLPFLNLSADPDNEFFADGITEDVIAQLSKIRSLKVISRGSVMGFKQREQNLREIGVALDVETLLEGSVRRAGDRVRIVAQLLDAATSQHLWAETYDRQLTDIFAIQTDVALQIAAALRAELSRDERTRIRREPTADVRAYQLYLQGRHCYTRYTEESIRKGIDYFKEAIAGDPGYAMAHVGAALAYAELAAGAGGGTLRPDEAYHEGMEAVSAALELDPDLGEAHAVLALLRMVHDFDWAWRRGGIQAGARVEPGRRRHLRSLRLALRRDGAVRRGAGAGAARAGARPADAPGGRRLHPLAGGPERGGVAGRAPRSRVRSRVRASALHAGVGLPEVGDAGSGSGRAGARGAGSRPGTRCTWRSSARPTG